ncbi:ComF family protein [Desulfococcus sp.]|uniref:ComF family protein n=1 Tax=Desulfococcus sp. TaxID=2025834 RepID=UPI0035933EDE
MTPAFVTARGIHRACRALLDLAFPPKCLVCGTFYLFPPPGPDPAAPFDAPPQAFSAVMAPFFCPACRDDFPCADGPVCSHCGKKIPHPDGVESVCDACLNRQRHFRKVRAFGSYDGSLKTALHHLKYRSITQLARPLGSLLFATFLRHWPDRDIDFIVPVPLHPRKFRRRGFNQAFLLLRKWPALAEKTGIDLPGGIIQRTALNRIRETDAQVGMNRRTRQANIQNAFTPGRGVDVSGKKILLVDDVYTTGATADACAEALRNAGAVRVDVLTLAQTVRNL